MARLRDFSTRAARASVVPTLVLPPQAGHDSCIVDYSPEQSQMRTILDAGLTRAFALDWIGATRRPGTPRSTTTSTVIDRAVDHVGGRVNLIGDCQGGWLATIYAALHPERVNTLTIAGAPIDFHCRRAGHPRGAPGARARRRPGLLPSAVAPGGGQPAAASTCSRTSS